MSFNIYMVFATLFSGIGLGYFLTKKYEDRKQRKELDITELLK